MDIEVAIKVLNSAIARENVMRNIFRPHMYLIIYVANKYFVLLEALIENI